MAKEKLLTRNFCLLTTSNFLVFFAFYMILPVLPFFLKDTFHTNNAQAGAIISSFTISTMCIRPFGGYILDLYARKPIYIISFFIFTAVFGGYISAGTLLIIIIWRSIHGLSYGMLSVAGNTLVIDVTPSSRRGEGIGYFGVANNIAMCFGPMAALFLYKTYSCNVIFAISLCCSLLGMMLGSGIKVKTRSSIKSTPLSFDRFILLKGIPAGISFMIIAIPYALIVNFLAVYTADIGLGSLSGFFFTVFAVGLIGSRLFSGSMVDHGKIVQVIIYGMVLIVIAISSLWLCKYVSSTYPSVSKIFFLATALCAGLGFGSTFPAYNSLFLFLAPNSKRSTAVSTYLTCWDVGTGIGILSGGLLGEYLSFSTAYLVAAVLTLLSTLYFRQYVAPHFMLNRVS
jgi:MFS family permease